MSVSSGVPIPSCPSQQFVEAEIRRLPSGTKSRFRRLGLYDDLSQELHLAYYEAGDSPEQKRRAVHAASERLRYREILRRARREVPEDMAPAWCSEILYGERVSDEHENN